MDEGVNMAEEKLFRLKQSETTKGMWFMMQGDLIVKVKYGENGKETLRHMVTERNNK